MNSSVGRHLFGVPPSGGPDRLKPGLRTGGSRKEPSFALHMHWDHEPVSGTPLVWCPAFGRSGPAEAGTPNGRFMESPLSLCARIGTMNALGQFHVAYATRICPIVFRGSGVALRPSGRPWGHE